MNNMVIFHSYVSHYQRVIVHSGGLILEYFYVFLMIHAELLKRCLVLWCSSFRNQPGSSTASLFRSWMTCCVSDFHTCRNRKLPILPVPWGKQKHGEWWCSLFSMKDLVMWVDYKQAFGLNIHQYGLLDVRYFVPRIEAAILCESEGSFFRHHGYPDRPNLFEVRPASELQTRCTYKAMRPSEPSKLTRKALDWRSMKKLVLECLLFLWKWKMISKQICFCIFFVWTHWPRFLRECHGLHVAICWEFT